MTAAADQPIYQQAQTLLQAILQAMQPADYQLDKQLDNQLDKQPDRLKSTVLQTHLDRLQQLLQPVAVEAAADGLAAKVQPWQIEINKQLRLLETDAIFLKAARQPTTVQQRHQQIQTRIKLLLSYCEAILALYAAPDPDLPDEPDDLELGFPNDSLNR